MQIIINYDMAHVCVIVVYVSNLVFPESVKTYSLLLNFVYRLRCSLIFERMFLED